jgi:uncharacterized membrane protein/ribosomal protein L40E
VTIQSNKTLGGVGAILTLLGVIGTILTVFQYSTLDITSATINPITIGVLGVSGILSALSFVGFILFLVAMHGFSKDYNEHRIFSYILKGLIATIVLAVVTGVIWFVLFMVSILNVISTLNPVPPASSFQLGSLITPYYAPLMAAMTVVLLVWIIYNYKAYNLLADKSGVHHFRNAAKIFVAGAAVNIAVGVFLAALSFSGLVSYNTLLLVSTPGGLIMYVAWAFVAKGFFGIQAPPTQMYTQPAVPQPAIQVKYCPNCGAQNRIDSSYCERCGQKLPPV